VSEDKPDPEAWEPERLDDEVAFAVSEAGRLRREEREVAFALEIIRLRAIIRILEK
jgi:hypothetical protein